MSGASRGWLRPAATLVGVLVVYFAVPDEGVWSGRDFVFSVLGMVAGTVVLGWAIISQVRRHLSGDAEDLQSLVTLLALVLVVFALGFYALERADPDQLAGLRTRVDALYFTLATMATVGYGDVHAVGQVARALVAVQIIFNIVFVGALASVLTGRVRIRARERDLARRVSSSLSGDQQQQGTGELDARTSALVRIAGLVALDAPAAAYRAEVAAAVENGSTGEELIDVLRSVGSAVGPARVAAGTSHVMAALALILPLPPSTDAPAAGTDRTDTNPRSPHDRVR